MLEVKMGVLLKHQQLLTLNLLNPNELSINNKTFS